VKRATRNSLLIHLAAGVVAVVILAPFAWMVIASVSPQSMLIAVPLKWIPDHLYLNRYVQIFTGADNAAQTFRAALGQLQSQSWLESSARTRSRDCASAAAKPR
jgi:multiple sugar transport system permease protein